MKSNKKVFRSDETAISTSGASSSSFSSGGAQIVTTTETPTTVQKELSKRIAASRETLAAAMAAKSLRTVSTLYFKKVHNCAVLQHIMLKRHDQRVPLSDDIYCKICTGRVCLDSTCVKTSTHCK